MTTRAARTRSTRRTSGRRRSPAAERSRDTRERAELAMTPGERLTLALELSDLCADLAAAGRLASRRRP